MAGHGAVDVVLAGVEGDGARVGVALLVDDQLEVADHLVVLQNDENVLHIVVVGEEDLDLTSRCGVRRGIPPDRGDGLDDEIGRGRNRGLGGLASASAGGQREQWGNEE